MSFGSNRRTDLFPQITTPSISECALIQSAIDPILLRQDGPQQGVVQVNLTVFGLYNYLTLLTKKVILRFLPNNYLTFFDK